MKNRVVITGAGTISPIGMGAEAVWRALVDGHGGVGSISGFEAASLPVDRAAQVKGFDIRDYTSKKGLGYLNRSAQFVCAASMCALNHAGLDLSRYPSDEIGLVLGTAFGSCNSMLAFDEECLRDGVRYVDPMGFPNTVTNAPAGYLSILLKAAGFNVTLSTNLASGLDAIDYAVKAIDDGRVRVAIAGGYDELSPATLVGLAEAGALAGAARTQSGSEGRDSVPMDRDRSGLFLGEGAGVLVLERLEDALEREANILGEIAGFGTSFCPSPDRASESMAKAMESALSSAGSGTKDVSCVLASANGSVECDRQERLAIEKTFRDFIDDGAGAVPVTAIKSMIGECGGAAGPIQLMAAALSTRFNAVPPTRGFRSGDPGSSLQVSPSGRAVDCDTVLVNCFNGENNNSSMVVKKTGL